MPIIAAGSVPNPSDMLSLSTMDITGEESSARNPAFGALSVMVKCVSSATLKPSSVSVFLSITSCPPTTSSGMSVFWLARISSRSKLYCTSEAVSAFPLLKTTPSISVNS